MFWSSLFASPIAWACRVPLIIETLHGTEAWRKGWKASNTIDRAVNCFVSKHVAVCESDARFLAEKKRVPASKIAIIHNGIDPQRAAVSQDARRAIRHAIGASEGDCVLITVARFHKGKGHHVLLEAMQKLAVRNPQAKLVLLGEGEEQAEMRSLCNSFGIAEHVRFAGFQPNVAEWLAAADVNVLPTFYEGFPLTVLEAMAAALPTVASNVGGIPETIEDGISGVLVSPGDPGKLANAITSLISDAETRARLGAAARARVLQYFTAEQQVQATENMYLDLLGDSRVKGKTRITQKFVPTKEWPSSADAN
jgi:glycosyltransferase involved in cell wall biosynthesis